MPEQMAVVMVVARGGFHIEGGGRLLILADPAVMVSSFFQRDCVAGSAREISSPLQYSGNTAMTEAVYGSEGGIMMVGCC